NLLAGEPDSQIARQHEIGHVTVCARRCRTDEGDIGSRSKSQASVLSLALCPLVDENNGFALVDGLVNRHEWLSEAKLGYVGRTQIEEIAAPERRREHRAG